MGGGEGEDENKGPFRLPDRAPVFFGNPDAARHAFELKGWERRENCHCVIQVNNRRCAGNEKGVNNKFDLGIGPGKRATDLSYFAFALLSFQISHFAICDLSARYSPRKQINSKRASLAQASAMQGTVNGRRVKMICWIHLGLLNAAGISWCPD